MYSHMMVGSNDLDESKTFYDALFGKEGRSRRQGAAESMAARAACSWSRQPIDGQPATPRQWLDDRLRLRQPRGSRRLAPARRSPRAAPRSRIRPGIRGNAFGSLYLAYLRDPDGNKLCAPASPRAMSIETVSEVAAHGGVQGVYRHASAATGGDMVFSLFMPPQVERGEPLPVLVVFVGADLQPRQRHRKRRVSRGVRRGGDDLHRPRHQPARAGRPRRSRGSL